MRRMLQKALVVAVVTVGGSSTVLAGVNESGGTVSCDFDLSPDTNPAIVGPTIERDRMYMAERPGMLRKNLPLTLIFDQEMHPIGMQSGGRYLFTTYGKAQKYLDWVRNDFVLGGVQFLERPSFVNPVCRAYRLVGNADLGDVDTEQVAMRTERFSAPADQFGILKQRFPALVEEARARGLTGVRLAYNPEEGIVELTYFANYGPSFDSYFALMMSPPLSTALADLEYTKIFDRTAFVLTVWYPYEAGDQGQPSTWLNSPPLPGPYPGDGLCVPSRGENHETAPMDCTPSCGDVICDADESPLNCPSDCRLE